MDPPKKVPPGPFSPVENGPPGPFLLVAFNCDFRIARTFYKVVTVRPVSVIKLGL